MTAILSKLDAATNLCKRIASVGLSDGHVLQFFEECGAKWEVQQNAYESVPMSTLSPRVRGQRLEQLGRAVDAELCPAALFESPARGTCVNGSRRSSANAEYDWCRDGRRIECKSSMFSGERSSQTWKLTFSGIKLALNGARHEHAFDELWLAIYSPFGVHFFKHDFKFCISTNGISTSACGHNIQIRGPRQVTQLCAVLGVVTNKLEVAGCQALAVVRW